jgi:DNA repair protein RecO (recombination protein O)
MEWTDRGIVLSARRHGESSAIVVALTPSHGRHAGLVRGAFKRQGGTYEPGNLVQLRWRARLDEHLGNFTGELLHSHAASLLDDPPRLAALTSACALTDSALPERERHDKVYLALSALLAALETGETGAWQAAYARFELDLLTDLGFGLDLSHCAATGATESLAYVSPKTGRAVSMEAGEPYRDKLLALPAFLAKPDAAPASPMAVAAALALTGYFLERHVFAPHGKTIPAARTRLIDRIGACDNVLPAKDVE